VRAIRSMAQELGYRKNSSAAALAAGKHNVIGVFVHREGTPVSANTERMVHGISEQAARHGQRLTLSFYQTSEQFLASSGSIHRSVIDGAIIGGLIHTDLAQTVVRLQRDGVPIVTVHDQRLAAGIPNVGTDQIEVCRLATRHLIERGCRRIAHVSRMELRLAGYRLALEEAGLGYRPELVYHARGYLHSDGQDAAAHFAATGVEYDGVVAQSDAQAAGFMRSLQQMGRRVPDEIRMAGIDDSPFCEMLAVPLTSVSEEFDRRGREAARLLLSRIAGDEVKSVEVAPVLRVRESSGG
jgi:LacI family transcriptional regulator